MLFWIHDGFRKLVVYPNGNENKNVNDHISLYLEMVDTSSLGFGWEVYAIFRLFVLDQNKDEFLILQGWLLYSTVFTIILFLIIYLRANCDLGSLHHVVDAMGKERRFHGLKLEWGFDQFIPLEEFNDASNGYLVDDTCVFGAEVLVKERNKCKGECLSMTKLTSASIYKHVWKIENFSKLEAKLYESEVFVAGDQKWYVYIS